jgi:NAD(P)-dependent dehydrogenase (short-subunit alcohol dehydrogenase family)
LYGTAVLFEEFGNVIARGGSCVVIGSQSSHRLAVDALTQAQADALATLPPEELLELALVKDIEDSLYAYQISKRCNALRVMSEAVRWGKRGARINCISAGIIFTPLAYDELNNAERGAFYRNMLDKSPAGRGGTPDEIGALAEFLFGSNGTYVTGSDLLIDGGATASYKYGELRPQ